MPGNHFMQSVSTLASQIDGERDLSETQLNVLEKYLLTLPAEDRGEVRRQMILIIAGLSRLEVRMVAAVGPLNTAV